MIIRSAGLTVSGKVRKSNQDNFYVNGAYKTDPDRDSFAIEDGRDPAQNVFAVCDGMGGYEHGEKASFLALRTLGEQSIDHIFADPADYVTKANRTICDEIIGDTGESVGTTLALMGVSDGKAFFCNVGDSRIYMVRNGEICQMSLDHTRAQSMINAGIIDAGEARNMKEAHILSQHLGIREDEFIIVPEIRSDHVLVPGDVYILCSDGLTSMVEDDVIGGMVDKSKDKEAKMIAVELVYKALENGGKDNISVIVVKVDNT